MITKILFTVAIIVAVIFFTRQFSPPTAAGRQRGSRTSTPTRRSGAPVRLAAYAVIALILGSTALWLVLEWRSAHEIVQVQVINSATGNQSEYEAYRTDVDRRSFRTLDGRRVNLAEVERLEVGPAD